MKDIPVGNVTFLFTDIEGSTKLSQEFPDKLQHSLDRHHMIMQNAIESNKGFVFEIVGDAFFSAFENASDAVNSAVDAQVGLGRENWNEAVIKVRIGIHTGNAEWKNNKYMGYITLARTSRIMSAAHGEQIIVSGSVYQNAIEKIKEQISFRDLGERHLKDLVRPEHVYQVLNENLRSDFPPLKTVDARSNNLPHQTTNFIGRSNEIREVKSILNKTRLLTIMGTGGTGKTRLSIEAASLMTDEFRNGVWFIELAQLTDPVYVHKEITLALKLNADNSCELANLVKDKELLLILDNCEHLLDECAVIVEILLRTCPRIKIIATSRIALRVSGECVYNVPTLTVPDLKIPLSIETLNRYESVSLFIDRALSVNNKFTVNHQNMPALAELCIRLDGIPLAIELAAARTRVISMEKILEKINDRFRILTSGSRASLPRQQTLRALIDWSYDLLSEKEKLLFSRLSIFSGGWTLEAAEEVCSDDEIDRHEILELLSNLIEKSLVISNSNDGDSRYTMLETIKHYGFEKLVNKNKIQEAHYKYFLNICKERENHKGSDQIKWYSTIKTEHDNLRTAINFYMDIDPELSLRLVNEMSDAWEMNGIISEGYEKYKELFGKQFDYDKSALALGLMHGGFLASQCGDYETAHNYLYQSLEIERTLDDKISLANILNNIGNLHFIKEEMDIAKKFHKEALELGLQTNDKLTIGLSKINIASINVFFGDKENSYELYSQGLEIFRELDDKLSVARILSHIARIEYEKKNYDKSLVYYEESLPILNEFGDHIVKSTTLLNMGNIFFSQKKYDETETLYNESLSISKENGYTNLYIHSLIKLAEVAHAKENYSRAKELLTESIKLCHKDSDKYKLTLCFKGFCDYYVATNNYEKSAMIIGIVEGLSEAIGFSIGIDRELRIRSSQDQVKMKIGEEKFNLNYQFGKKLNQEEAIELAISN